MAKPILVLRLPNAFSSANDKIQKATRKGLNEEYHVICVSTESEEVVFEVYNVDKEEPINYSQLKKLIKQA